MKTVYKIIRIIPAVFIISIIFSGCQKSSYNQLTEEELTWMVYSNQQTFNFISASGNLRKYVVSGVYRSYDKSGRQYDERAGAGIKLENDPSAHPSSGSLILFKKSTGLEVTINWPHFSATAYLTSLIPTLDTINNVPYNDIYVADVPITEPNFSIERIKYSRTKGFIQYIEDNGEVWTLSN